MKNLRLRSDDDVSPPKILIFGFRTGENRRQNRFAKTNRAGCKSEVTYLRAQFAL